MDKSRKFSVHPQMIFSLIRAQAGTLGKAVLENVMNSVDADATAMTIDITRDRIVIVDNGHGFRSVKEIEDCFEVFGFPHEEGARRYGQFGIGRAQLWAFSSATWRTNTYRMDVDIKNKGLDYKLKENQPQVDGLTIESKFYTPMTTQDIQVFKQELKELALYAQIPVKLNGEVINVDPRKGKWNFDTEDAWIKLSDSSTLTVYNLGVMVKRFSAYQVGSGGVVVTKPGVKLSLNMARNDILVSDCKVWARIKPFIQKKSDEKVRKKSTRLSEEELENRALRFVSGEVGYPDIADFKLVTDITGRSHTLREFMDKTLKASVTVVSIEKEGSNLGDRAHTSKLAFVIHPKVLARFGVESLDDFKTALFDAFDNAEGGAPYWLANFRTYAVFEADLGLAVPSLREGYTVLAPDELTKKEKCALRALANVDHSLRSSIRKALDEVNAPSQRELRGGLSDTALAWTDSSSFIVFSRTALQEADKGIGGFVHLIGTLVHEYLHDRSSMGTHIHDEMFYKRFHDVHNSALLGEFAFEAYRSYTSQLLSAGIGLTRTTLTALNFEEGIDADPRFVEAKAPAALAPMEA
jgi:hypothetical protein